MTKTAAVIGAQPEVVGFALAGLRVYAADTAQAVRAAWHGLSDDIAVVILTAPAAEAIGTDRAAPDAPLTVVMPP